ncbi:MAG: triose-phosphate isomerase [Flavobacteriales bacterium]|jgi:triosephosphate isomerase (TIM)|nr:triose-phosphate isomerase [Flavobacteriales bacterium]
MRKKIVAGNWKMNLNKSEADILYNDLESKTYPDDVEVIIAPASIYLDRFSNASKVSISSQDVSANSNGAFTGEFSAEMLSSINLRFAIVGHSERRTFHKETDLLIFQKVEMLLKHGITPIFCCGESLSDRESENHFNVVKSQLSQILSNLSTDDFSKIVIAYEPVWAIGTGLTADPQDAQDMHFFIRGLISDAFGKDISDKTSILYGGSCKPSNSKELFSMKDIDGGLIGGASLDSESFEAIINSF